MRIKICAKRISTSSSLFTVEILISGSFTLQSPLAFAETAEVRYQPMGTEFFDSVSHGVFGKPDGYSLSTIPIREREPSGLSILSWRLLIGLQWGCRTPFNHVLEMLGSFFRVGRWFLLAIGQTRLVFMAIGLTAKILRPHPHRNPRNFRRPCSPRMS